MVLSQTQRRVLIAVALLGLLGPNGVFVYYALARWDALLGAMQHPVTLAFVIDALAAMALLAVGIARWPLGRWGWKAFVLLSLVGGLAFSIPAFVVMNSSRGER